MVAAATAGRRRWFERMRAMKAAGEIERFPNGTRKGTKPAPKGSRTPRTVSKARGIVAAQKAELGSAEPAGEASGATAGNTMTPRFESGVPLATKLAANASLALDRLSDILNVPVPYNIESLRDPEILAIAKLQTQRAAEVVTHQIKVEENAMRAPKSDKLGEILERLRAEGKRAREKGQRDLAQGHK